MSLSEKYKIPRETIQKMVNDGVISTTWPAYEEIYAMYQHSMSIGGKSKSEIYFEISQVKKVSESTVKNAITAIEKTG